MNLTKLFKTQAELDKKIIEEKGLQGQDLLDKKILALQVELGELANEWRGFKFWSEDQEPRTWFPNEKDVCKECKGEPIFIENGKIVGQCDNCDGCGVHFHNPLLEEYVDCLHFLLSIGLEVGIESDKIKGLFIWNSPGVDQFNSLFLYTSELYEFKWSDDYTKKEMKAKYINILEGLLGLGIYGLGFTWDEIEKAYYEKNKINHERQANGY